MKEFMELWRISSTKAVDEGGVVRIHGGGGPNGNVGKKG